MDKNLNNLLKRLLDAKIDFVLIGGFAAIAHGGAQVTQDLDICAVLTDENLEKFRNALHAIHPRFRMNPNIQPTLDEYPKKGVKIDNLYLSTDEGVLDVLEVVRPVGDFARIKSKAQRVKVFGHECLVMGLDDLIEVKKAMPREKDKATLEDLLKIKKLKNS